MDEWLSSARARLAAAIDVDEASLELDEELLLELARVAAHESGARTNAPLACYLVGLAVGKSGRDLNEVAEIVLSPEKPMLTDTATS